MAFSGELRRDAGWPLVLKDQHFEMDKSKHLPKHDCPTHLYVSSNGQDFVAHLSLTVCQDRGIEGAERKCILLLATLPAVSANWSLASRNAPMSNVTLRFVFGLRGMRRGVGTLAERECLAAWVPRGVSTGRETLVKSAPSTSAFRIFFFFFRFGRCSSSSLEGGRRV